MKQILYTILTVFFLLFSACTDNERKRAQRLTDEFDASFLEGNQSVKAVGRIRLDSARVEFLYLPDTRDRLQKVMDLVEENKKIQQAIRLPGLTEVSYNIYSKQLWETGDEAERIQRQLMEQERNYDPRIPGWMSYHRFRVIGKDGAMKLYQYVLYFDPQVRKIQAVLDMNDSVPVYRVRED